MNKFIQKMTFICLGASAVLSMNVHSAVFTVYGDRTAFLTALGGTTMTQDFESFSDGDNMVGVDFLPGVSVSTNMDRLEIFKGSGDQELFGFNTPPKARGANGAFAAYNINLSESYKAIGFDIDAFDPAANPGLMAMEFADGDFLDPFSVPPGASEQDPVFIGVISDTDITGIEWREPFDPLSGGCCEETALDNFVVPQAVPLPSALALAMPMYGLFAGLVWRRRKSIT
jgi:hypothetical protein